MDIGVAQRDVRQTFLGGFAGQTVSAVVWAASAAGCMWGSLKLGEVLVLVGGCFIFPLTQLLLRAMGHAHGLPKGHPMNALGMQVAFTLPPGLLVALAIAALKPGLFYPAVMILLGAHYLPFIFMYGMWQFGVLAGVLIAGGVVVTRLPVPSSFAPWMTAVVLLITAFVGRHVALSERAAS